MSAPKTDMHRLQEAVRLHRLGNSHRRVAQLLSMGRVTVTRYFAALDTAGLLDGDPSSLPSTEALRAAVECTEERKPPPQEISSLESWRELIAEKRREGASPQSVHDYLRRTNDDYRGSISAMKRLFARLAKKEGPKATSITIPVVTSPGEVAQVDFTYAGLRLDAVQKVARKTWIFVMTLGHSRATYAEFTFDQNAATWTRVHINAFEHFGGVPAVLVPDNLKAAVVKRAFGADAEIELNRNYRELARAYGFQIDPTPVRAPEKKGKVERDAKYIKFNFLRSLDDVDVDEAQRQLLRWLREIAGERVHGSTKRRPNEVFAREELSALLPLPASRWKPVLWRQVTVHRDSHVQVSGALYSVPWTLIGKKLWARHTHEEVSLFSNDVHIYTHRRAANGQRRTVDAHLPEHRRDLRHRSQSYWEERAALLGEDVERLIAAVFAADDVLLQLRRVQGIVTELEKYPAERARRAARRALYFASYELRAIRSILRKGLDLQPLPNEDKPKWSTGSRYARNPTPTLFSDIPSNGHH